MSEHRHDHKHEHRRKEDCRCQECEDNKDGTERTSIEEAGGVAAGLTGHIHGFNADAAARLSNALLATGKWVEKESGPMLGHIKAAVYNSEGKGITFNLTDLDNGVEQHGTLPPHERVSFSFMSAVLDVDPHELEHVMLDALEDTGMDYHLEKRHDHDHHHGHDHHGHSHNDKNEVCHCKACEGRRKEETERVEKGTFWDKIRRRKE